MATVLNLEIMQEVTRDCIVSLTLFAAVFGMVYVFLMTRHRERMAMLERGVNTSPFHRPQQNGLATLKYGMLLVGIGIGFIMGAVLYSHFEIDEAVSFLSMVTLFGGLSLIINYLIVKNKYADKD